MKRILAEKNSGEKITVQVKDVIIGGDDLVFISGPCAVENYDKMIKIGRALKDQGAHMMRAGAFISL